MWMSLARFSTASRDHGVDQADDRRLAGHVAQVFEIGGGLLVVAIGEGLAVAFAVVAVDGVEDFLLGGQHGLNLQAGEAADGRDGVEIQRIGHGHGEGGIVQRDREGAALAQEARARGRRSRAPTAAAPSTVTSGMPS